ncbi:MAG: hypothetical protein RJA70_3118 [Pseudomonadota bacterium]
MYIGPVPLSEEQRRTFFRIRVGVLLLVLVLVLLFAYKDFRSRAGRKDWNATLNVAVVLLTEPGVSPAALRDFRARFSGLTQRLSEEFERYGHAPTSPVLFTVAEAIERPMELPKPAQGSIVEVLNTNYELWRFSRRVNERLAFDVTDYKSRIYVSLRVPKVDVRRFVEGFSQQGGHMGVVEVELAEDSIDFALFVVAHELFHTLGATDKYGPDGRTRLPDGLAEPELRPLYPQRFAEVMARNRPINEHDEVPPNSLDELAVGELTAREIGWIE